MKMPGRGRGPPDPEQEAEFDRPLTLDQYRRFWERLQAGTVKGMSPEDIERAKIWVLEEIDRLSHLTQPLENDADGATEGPHSDDAL